MLLIQQDNNGQTFEAAVGQTFEISTPGESDHWLPLGHHVGKVGLPGRAGRIPPSAAGASGGPGEHAWEFKAVAPGDCEIELSYRRPWQTDGPPAQAFKVHVHVTP